MGSLTIRNLDDALKRRLRLRAAGHGRSMEEEVREILRTAVCPSPAPADLGRSIHAHFARWHRARPAAPGSDATTPGF
jgi:plasmid stability protein